MRFIIFIRTHKKTSIVGVLVLISLIYMWMTDTLTYPYIMTERQIQLIVHCVNPDKVFIAKPYGYEFSVPEGYCAMPHRIYPDDGTVHIIPKGWYFVINEYAKGTVTESAVATLLFIHDDNGKEIAANMKSLHMGGFLNQATEKTTTNAGGMEVTEYDNAIGIDETRHFNWAFIANPDKTTSLTVLTDKVNETKIYDEIISTMKYSAAAK